ncbi:hypothetical protein [Caulobacter sp. NIBR1757]|uniref:hypothetical protein n=1 Tax=Caulobacter sp. NIBR1757 TaxID=3016000 RepID=UPI0022F0AFD5|nr:hypothetical protein [Caulobacter sp. NIBR1757]WGM40021.1 hypothetical protein AMEJIAPC_02962 [Caulobacter sp. NIBR1757]
MLYPNARTFLNAPSRTIALMGMSNVGKTRLGGLLPRESWFHYSVDYRLATAHLRETILDTLKAEMMNSPTLARHLRDEAMSVDLGISFSNLSVLSHYLGMLGDPARGGLAPDVFRYRQAQHRQAEIAAVQDMTTFITRARQIYDYPDFLFDASGSLCELIDPADPADPLLGLITRNTLLVHIVAGEAHEAGLIEAARTHPKPLYYRPEFLDAAVAEFLEQTGLEAIEQAQPEAFTRWVFPRLLAARRPRYEAIARHGVTVLAEDAAQVGDERDFLTLVAEASR